MIYLILILKFGPSKGIQHQHLNSLQEQSQANCTLDSLNTPATALHCSCKQGTRQQPSIFKIKQYFLGPLSKRCNILTHPLAMAIESDLAEIWLPTSTGMPETAHERNSSACKQDEKLLRQPLQYSSKPFIRKKKNTITFLG